MTTTNDKKIRKDKYYIIKNDSEIIKEYNSDSSGWDEYKDLYTEITGVNNPYIGCRVILDSGDSMEFFCAYTLDDFILSKEKTLTWNLK